MRGRGVARRALDKAAAAGRVVGSTAAHPVQRTVWVLGPRLGTLRQYAPRPLTEQVETTAATNLPSISIVTPSYDQGEFLAATLASVLGQDYPRLEYVVQDGGSSDASVAILQSIDDPRFGWASEPDDGQAQAINRGFARTDGEVMAWLNSDDLLVPGSLRYVGAYFAANPEVDAVYGHRVLIDGQGAEIGRWVLPPHDGRALTWADYIPQETLFWRRRLWEQAGGLDESFRFAMDWDLLLRFQAVGARIVRLPRFLGCFRVHDEQLTSSAIDTLGAVEMDRLRRRCHGRPVSSAEVGAALVPYLARHLALHGLWRAGIIRYAKTS